jgi:hypothetical protein
VVGGGVGVGLQGKYLNELVRRKVLGAAEVLVLLFWGTGAVSCPGLCAICAEMDVATPCKPQDVHNQGLWQGRAWS